MERPIVAEKKHRLKKIKYLSNNEMHFIFNTKKVARSSIGTTTRNHNLAVRTEAVIVPSIVREQLLTRYSSLNNLETRGLRFTKISTKFYCKYHNFKETGD